MNSIAFAVALGLLTSPLPFQYQDSRFVIGRAAWRKEVCIIEYKTDMTVSDAFDDPTFASDMEPFGAFANFTGVFIVRGTKEIFVNVKDEKNPDIKHFKLQPCDVIDFRKSIF